jgi:hypothetical protein
LKLKICKKFQQVEMVENMEFYLLDAKNKTITFIQHNREDFVIFTGESADAFGGDRNFEMVPRKQTTACLAAGACKAGE